MPDLDRRKHETISWGLLRARSDRRGQRERQRTKPYGLQGHRSRTGGNSYLRACSTLPFYCGKQCTGIYFVLSPEKASTYSSEYASGFSEPAVAHLPAPSSPRDEGQCRTGSNSNPSSSRAMIASFPVLTRPFHPE